MKKSVPNSVNCLIELTLKRYASAAREYLLTLSEEEIAILGIESSSLTELTEVELIRKIYLLRESNVTWAGSFSSKACELGVEIEDLMNPTIKAIVSNQINFIAKIMKDEAICKIFQNIDRCRDILNIGQGLSLIEINNHLSAMIKREKVKS